nr:type II toxin-antitoxin system RelE/ParE family toxin [Candidatus Sigynarchaeum springense]
MAKIEWTERALADLQQVHDYIARDSVFYANSFAKKVYERVQSLQSSPEIGRKVPEMDDPSIRELIHQSYRIIYEIEEDLVRIVTIFHGSRVLRY